MCYAFEAQRLVAERMHYEGEDSLWPMEESIREKETILEMIEGENFE